MTRVGERWLLGLTAMVAAVHLQHFQLVYEARALMVLAVLIVTSRDDGDGRWIIDMGARRCEDPVGLATGSLIAPLLCSTFPQNRTALQGAIALGLWFRLCVALRGRWLLLSKSSAGASLALISLLTTATVSSRIEILPMVFSFMLGASIHWLVIRWKGSFTLAEAALNAMVAVGTFQVVTDAALSRNFISVEEALLLGAISAVYLESILLVPMTVDGVLRPVSFAVALSFIAGLIYLWVINVSGREPVRWLLESVIFVPQRRNLAIFWVLCLFIVVVVAPPQSLGLSAIVARKVYHFLAVLLFAPGILFDFSFQSLAMGIAFALLFTLEVMRRGRIWPASDPKFQRFIISLVDERDSGILILTHLYLLLGCSLPVWLLMGDGSARYQAFCGLAVLGISDSFASIVGRRLGRTQWPGTKKTVEGSLAAWIAGSLFQSFFSPEPFLRVLMAMFPVTLLEAWSCQLDNLILPPFGLCMIRLFASSATPDDIR